MRDLKADFEGLVARISNINLAVSGTRQIEYRR